MNKKNIIVVTGGAGFIGHNLILRLLDKTKFKIISIDNYTTGKKDNHVKNLRVKYLRSHTKNISKILTRYKKNIHSLFHFGEFSRIYQSFNNLNDCIDSNLIGTYRVFNFCLNNKIKLIYSATSASIGNKGNDKNLSPYAFTKSKNLELLENFKKWFNFKYEVIYFYNVYGPGQIKTGSMATVIGIFEDQFSKKKSLTVVKPGSQSRRFTHIFDTIDTCFFAWKKNKCSHYSISHKKSYTIMEVARMFKSKIRFVPYRKGERYASALTDIYLSNKVIKRFGKINIKDYVANVVKNS